MSICGASGSGKSTLANAIANTLDIPMLELDALYHQAQWTPLDADDFRARVAEFVAQPSWICDGNYEVVRAAVWSRATVIVLLDLPRWRVMLRLGRRTLRRALWREELWNGNKESWRNLMSRDPERNILLWSWRTHARRRSEVPVLARRDAAHARFVVITRNRERRQLLEELRAP
ncbi:MAG: hypothetical protein B7X07_02690 [Actinobacteria bacterium 21-64-8]|nr:MAG: hypothetical protein B7X07_02690 [Actinobacteria bacterium 21-64-8]